MKTKPTAKALNEHLGKGNTFMHDMKRDRPKQYEIMMLGWNEYCRLNAIKESKGE